ncbi:uL22 family ribosomal protein [candidate division WWE3 bacterium]|uniref:50S ribosomal protein L22 n=1 Tax=candidate division WWE3 bacterium TaxID=2053526 RepID=A0A955RQX4_UNCKA|nr:uL22 family ribosomal protein [candidate division WWE3 bacterium]
MRVVANAVKDLPLDKMRERLKVSTKKAAPYILKVVNAAVANAVNNFSLHEDDLVLEQLQIGDGRKVRKPKYRARGRMDVTRTRYSNIRVVLGLKDGVVVKEDKKSEKKEAKVEEKETAQETKKVKKATTKAKPKKATKKGDK